MHGDGELLLFLILVYPDLLFLLILCGSCKRNSVTYLCYLATVKMKPKTIEEIFDKAQLSTIHHSKLLERLFVLLIKMSEDDFKKLFLQCLKISLATGDKTPAIRILDFVSRFCALLEEKKNYPDMQIGENANPVENGNTCNDKNEEEDEVQEDDEPMNPFVSFIFRELLELHACSNQSIRMRVCYCIKKILQCMGPEASIDSEICDAIYAAMLDRLKDRSPAVRAQAVTALERLQDPSDPECPVIKAFLFHLCRDPSADVRRAVLVCLGRSKHTLAYIRNRIYDIKDTVRKQAYISLSKVSVRSHSIKNRELILSQGIRDRSDIVRDTVEKVLLPNWFENCHNNFIEFLRVLDVENGEIGEDVLKVLFRLQPKEKLINSLELDANKLIPSENLTVESSFYWRCLADFLQSEEDGQWELVLPELSLFCEYIKSNLCKLTEANVGEKLEAWNHTQNDYIILQLLHLTKIFDLADEAGREKLKELLQNMLLSSDTRLKLIPTVMDVLVEVVPDVSSRLLLVAETISEIHEPLVEENVDNINIPDEKKREMDFKLAQLRVQKNIVEDDLDLAVKEKKFLEAEDLKNKLVQITAELETLAVVPKCNEELQINRAEDPSILSKCLTIVFEMMQSPTVTTLTPQLRSLLENFVKNSLKVEHAIVQVIALQCLGVFALLDESLAKDFIVVFCVYLGSSCDEIAIVAAKGIFDLLLMYGLKTFCITEEDDALDEAVTKKKKVKKNLMNKSTILEDSNGSVENESKNVQGDSDNEQGDSDENNYHLLSLLTKHLDTSEGQLLGCVVEGLCKLLLGMRISSPKLISRLILLWFNPVHEDDIYLRQVLGQFFKIYAVHCPLSQETLEQSFFPTINTLLNAPCSSPLYQVNVETVAKFLLDLTKSGVNQYSAEVNIHNNLALKVCNELLLDTYDEVKVELISLLCHMDLALDEDMKSNMQTLVKKISKTCTDRACARAIQKVESKLNSESGTLLSDPKSSETTVEMNSTVLSNTKLRNTLKSKGSSVGSGSEIGRLTSRNESCITIPSRTDSLATSPKIIPETSESESDSVFEA